MANNDTVEYCNADYAKYQMQWERCKDVIKGSDAVKAKGPLYLPVLGGQKAGDTKYLSYKQRSSFFNATGRTVDALTGLVNAKAPVTKMPPALEEMVKDTTLSGMTLSEFHNELLENVIGEGRSGILVDFPKTSTAEMTIAEAKALNLRPYARIYEALHIRNWRTITVNSEEVLSMVVLQEDRCTDGMFATSIATQYRVLDLFIGFYRQRVWYKVINANTRQEEWVFDEYFPMMNGKMMTRIPFRFVNVDNSKAKPQTPPLLDLVDTNLAHYLNSADYEHGLHFSGLPQPYVAGATLEDGKKLHIGSPEAWVFSDPQAKAGYMEFNGQGLKPLADALAAKERRMAVLGARMLADEKKAAEAVEAIEIRFSGENSVLSSIARTISESVTWMLELMAEWEGITGEIKFMLNTDYHLMQMAPGMVTALVGAWQEGAITFETLFYALQNGEIVQTFQNLTGYQETATKEKAARDALVTANALSLAAATKPKEPAAPAAAN